MSLSCISLYSRYEMSFEYQTRKIHQVIANLVNSPFYQFTCLSFHRKMYQCMLGTRQTHLQLSTKRQKLKMSTIAWSLLDFLFQFIWYDSKMVFWQWCLIWILTLFVDLMICAYVYLFTAYEIHILWVLWQWILVVNEANRWAWIVFYCGSITWAIVQENLLPSFSITISMII